MKASDRMLTGADPHSHADTKIQVVSDYKDDGWNSIQYSTIP